MFADREVLGGDVGASTVTKGGEREAESEFVDKGR